MIKLKDVTKRYGDRVALSHIDLEIVQGELVVLKGVSGSGKSTLLSLMSALTKPTSGDVVVDGVSLSKMADHFAADFRRDHIGFVFQKHNLIAGMSVERNIELPLVPLNLSTSELQSRVEQQLKHYELLEYRKSDVAKLSGGQQQRVAIARANINNPKIILADEPTSNLDADLSRRFIKQVEQMKEQGKTVVIATHDPLFFDLETVDRVCEIRHGKLIG